MPNNAAEPLEAAGGQPEQTSPKQRIKKRWKYKNKFLKCCFLLFLYAGLLVALQLKGSMLSYDIIGLRQEISSLQTANHRIEFQIQQLSCLARIEAIAVTELNMVMPEWNQSVTVARMVAPLVPAEEYIPTGAAVIEPENPMARFFNAFLAFRQP